MRVAPRMPAAHVAGVSTAHASAAHMPAPLACVSGTIPKVGGLQETMHLQHGQELLPASRQVSVVALRWGMGQEVGDACGSDLRPWGPCSACHVIAAARASPPPTVARRVQQELPAHLAAHVCLRSSACATGQRHPCDISTSPIRPSPGAAARHISQAPTSAGVHTQGPK
jgi:hypothetical protein